MCICSMCSNNNYKSNTAVVLTVRWDGADGAEPGFLWNACDEFMRAVEAVSVSVEMCLHVYIFY